MDFYEEMEQKVSYVNDTIEHYLPEEKGLQKTVLEAMNYSVSAGGKRIRSVLILESYRLFHTDAGAGDEEIIYPFLAAMEMIQTYSLVHDDLPAMDNDEYRRGKKSTHAAYGEAMGILAGDALLNYAFELMSQAFDIECSRRVAKAMQVLAKKAGVYGMIGGQVVDVESEGKEIPFETLQFIHQYKCGALIEAAMMMGAILAGASEEDVELMEQVGSDVGVAFQIQDDILDVTSTTEELGKPIGSDEKNQKATYVTFAGLDAARAKVKELSEHALSLLATLPKRNEFLEELITYLIYRGK